VLGRYRLLERLGAGGFGVVWRAYDEELRREVAVKQIHLPADGEHERATREAQACARLAHPAIVALYEARAEGDAFYLVSELVHGETLAVLIAEGALSDEQALEIGLALSDALAHAHERGVIHRDVKPQNILVSDEPTERGLIAKLTDFGGARLAGEEALTRTGDVLGTLAYMAPEQSEGHEATAAADLYSLALVLYEALCGANPVRGRTPAATARRIGSVLPSLEHRRGDLPRELTRALDRALAPEPQRRGTLADLHAALAAALQDGLDRRRRRVLTGRRPRRSLRGQAASPARGWSTQPPRAHVEEPLRARVARPPHAQVLEPPQSPSTPQAQTAASPAPRRLRLPRGVWLAAAAAAAIWQASVGRAGVGLLALVAALPLLLPVRLSPRALLAAFAPALGLVGLAGVFPALAGQASQWRARAALAALGYWWLCLAEPLFARRLWLAPPSGGGLSRAAWESSLGTAAAHTIAPLLTLGVLFGAASWALGAAVLPLLVRGRGAALDLLAASLWTGALLAAAPLLDYGLPIASGGSPPRGALPAALAAGAVAVAARAVRGPV
jgi:serine/threonine protein kinase